MVRLDEAIPTPTLLDGYIGAIHQRHTGTPGFDVSFEGTFDTALGLRQQAVLFGHFQGGHGAGTGVPEV